MEFLLILLPVFGIFAIGFVGQKTLKFDIPNLSKLTLYLMSPFLAFNTFLYQSAYDRLCIFGDLHFCALSEFNFACQFD